MTVKLIRAVTRQDGRLYINDGGNNSVEDAFLNRGWEVIGCWQGGSSNEVVFVVQRDEESGGFERNARAALGDRAFEGAPPISARRLGPPD